MPVRCFSASYLDCYAGSGLVEENKFISAEVDRSTPPSIHDPDIKARIPAPFWDGAQGKAAVDCYWKTWSLAFANLRRVHSGNKFIAPFIDTAFNDCERHVCSFFFSLICSRYFGSAYPTRCSPPKWLINQANG